MRLAYVVELDAYQSSGVLTKITTQVRIWNKLGAESKLFLISKPPGRSKRYAPAVNTNISWIHYNSFINFVTKLSGKKQNYLNKIFTTLSVKRELEEYQPDVIYYRFGIWFPGQLFRFERIPVVIELNSIDLDEYPYYDKLTQLINRTMRNRLLNRADGFCSVTEEIDKSVALTCVPSLVIGNGIEMSPNRATKIITKNQRAQLIFVGSSDSEWHGADKIVDLAKTLHDYDFHIVGPIMSSKFYDKDITNNVYFHGFLEADELSLLYKTIDIAIGTLALHRKKMEEASPLKVREYVAHGLPVVVGYLDTDLQGKSFILNIGNYENNVNDNAKRISDFVEYWRDKKIELDPDSIDMHKKEKQRIEYFRTFLK